MRFKRVKQHLGLGIDIGAQSIRWVELCQDASEVDVCGHGVEHLSADNRDEEVNRVLFDLVESHQIHCRQAHIAVSSQQTLKKSIRFTNDLSEKDIEQHLIDNQARYFSGIEDKLLFDFYRHHDAACGGDFSVIAIREREVTQQISLLQKNGFKVLSVEPDIYALVRLILFNKQIDDPTALYLLLDNQLSYYRAIIFNNKEILFEIDCSVSVDHDPVEIMWEHLMQRIQLQLPGSKITTAFFLSQKIYDQALFQGKLPVLFIDPFAGLQLVEVNERDKNLLIVALGLAMRGVDGAD